MLLYKSLLYYNHIFSYDEINSLIEGILFSKTIAPEDGEKLIEKIESHLTTKFYPKGAKQICRVNEPQLADQGRIRENLKMIQQAIEERVQIRFRFYGYNRRKELEPVREEKDTVSPYYLVANGGKYYLLACKEMTINKEIVRNMSIWRVDLMGEMENDVFSTSQPYFCIKKACRLWCYFTGSILYVIAGQFLLSETITTFKSLTVLEFAASQSAPIAKILAV